MNDFLRFYAGNLEKYKTKLRYILNCVFFITDRTIRIFYRKFYVWKVLSSRANWYLSKNGNLYNPTFRATVYPWNGEWNIARFNMHYSGFHSQEYAKKISFQKWYRQYKADNFMGLVNRNVSKSFIKQFITHYRITFIVFIVILTFVLYNFYPFRSKFDSRSKESNLIFNKKQEYFDLNLNHLKVEPSSKEVEASDEKVELGNEKIEPNDGHWILDRRQDNPYDEEMKKYRNARKECDKNFSFLSNEREECTSFFREKYKETIEGYDAFEKNKKQKTLERIKRNF